MLHELKWRGLLGVWHIGNSRAVVSTRKPGINERSKDGFLWIRNWTSSNNPKDMQAEWISIKTYFWLLE